MNPKLIHGDFFKLWQRTGIDKASLILTDPPFNVFSNLHSWDKSIDLVKLETIFDQLLKPSGQILIFCDLNLMVNLFGSFSDKLKYRCFYIWKKSGGMPVSRNRPINNSEFIMVFCKAGAKEKQLTWNPELMGEKGIPYTKRNYTHDIPTRRMKKSAVNQNLTGNRYPKSIIEAPGKPNMEAWERSNHPTQKPEILLRKLIRGYSNPGDLVLDCFAGSGSALISAFNEGRKAIGLELEKKYFQEAKQRIDSVTAQGRLW